MTSFKTGAIRRYVAAFVFCAVASFVLLHNGALTRSSSSSSSSALVTYARQPQNQRAEIQAHATSSEKLYFRPHELGVQHYTVLGELQSSGDHVNLHLWLTAYRTKGNSSSIRLQGFGMFETMDNVRFIEGFPHAKMPANASAELRSPGFLYLQAAGVKSPHITVKITQGGRSPWQMDMVPFYLEASWDETEGLPSIVLRVRNWRRFIALNLPDLLAEPAPICAGRFFVTTIASPFLTPAAAARLIVWHAKAHIAIGFTCEIVYLYHEHLSAVLADTAILQLVRRSQLSLVVVEGFLARFTLNSDEKMKGLISNFLNDTAVLPQWSVFNNDNVVIHAHVLLATRRKSAWLLIEDLDEFLVMHEAANVQHLLPDCFHGLSAEIEVVPAMCVTCVATGGGRELPVWLNTSETARHPLNNYRQERATHLKKKYPHWVVKSVVRPDEIVAFEIHIGTLKGNRKPLRSHVASKCGMFILHVINMHQMRFSVAPDPLLRNDWRWMLDAI